MRWNGQDLASVTPSLGLTLPTAQLFPEFVRQSLHSGLFHDVEHTQLTPLDDLRAWMRDDPWRTGDLFGELSDALLGEEKKARKAAEKAGQVFDQVAWELEQMEADESYDAMPPEWTAEVLKLAIDEADALLEWSLRELKAPFALAASFCLPDPRRHPRFRREEIEARLVEFGAPMAADEKRRAGRLTGMDLQGAFQLDLCRPGLAPKLQRGPEVGFVRVEALDARAGDQAHAHLSLAYPLAAEGYFLMTFDALRQGLTLKGGQV